MTTAVSRSFDKADVYGALSDAEAEMVRQMQTERWKTMLNSGLTHVRTAFNTIADYSLPLAEITGSDVQPEDIDAFVPYTGVSYKWTIQSVWMMDDGLKPWYLSYNSGERDLTASSTSSSYYGKFVEYMYLGDSPDFNNKTLYNVTSDTYGGSQFVGQMRWQACYTDGTFVLGMVRLTGENSGFALPVLAWERSRDADGNIDEKGTYLAFSSGGITGVSSGYQQAGVRYGLKLQDSPSFQLKSYTNNSPWYNGCLRHMPLPTDSNMALYDGNVLPLSTYVTEWGGEWYPTRALLSVPIAVAGGVNVDIPVGVNGQLRNYSSMGNNLMNAQSSYREQHWTTGGPEAMLNIWE